MTQGWGMVLDITVHRIPIRLRFGCWLFRLECIDVTGVKLGEGRLHDVEFVSGDNHHLHMDTLILAVLFLLSTE